MNKAKKSNLKSAKIKFVAFIILIAIMILVSIYFNKETNEKRHIKELAKSPIAFIIFYILVSFAPIPFAPTSFAAALFYPIGEAFIYTLIGNTIFITIVFLITRYLGKEYIEYLTRNNKKYSNFEKSFEENAFKNIIMMRIFFPIPGEIISMFCGMSKVKFKTYFIASFIGNIPLLFFTSMFVRAIVKHNSLSLIVSLLALLLMLIIPIIFVKEIRNHVKAKKNNK